MPKYTFIRSAPVMITVEAETLAIAERVSGHRLDDFLSEAAQRGPLPSHDPAHPENYTVAYHGDAIYSGDVN